MTTVRPAIPADAEVLARLRYEFRAAQNPAVESEPEFVARCVPWMRERLAPGSPWRCWVAEHGSEVIGQLWLQLIEKIPNPAPELEQHGYITNVFVAPGARGGGVGARLVEAALAYCREHRVDSIVLWPTDRSRALYRRHGFIEPTDMMELVLDENRDIH